LDISGIGFVLHNLLFLIDFTPLKRTWGINRRGLFKADGQYKLVKERFEIRLGTPYGERRFPY